MKLLRCGIPALIVFGICAFAGADLLSATPRAKIVPPGYLRTISDDELRPLPRYGPSKIPPDALGRPTISQIRYRTPAEYEPAAGILLRWGSFNQVLTQVIVGITTGDPDAQVFVVVNSGPQQQRATDILLGAGAVRDRISFIRYRSDSPWMRDYGPRFLSTDSPSHFPPTPRLGNQPFDPASEDQIQSIDDDFRGRTILDHIYNRGRHLDDQFPSYLSTLWGDPRISLPIFHAGGNFHVFSTGEAFATDRILSDNPRLKRWLLTSWLMTVANLNLTVFPSFPADFDQSGHIDMWMLPVADDQAIVAEYPADCGLPHAIAEEAANQLASRNFTVYRVPGWRSRGIHYSYTNALVFNGMVFVPSYKRFPKHNREALRVFETAFPTRQLIPVDCSRTVKAAGAIHCLVMQIPQR